MMSHKKISDFVRNNRVYMLMLVFILLVQVLSVYLPVEIDELTTAGIMDPLDQESVEDVLRIHPILKRALHGAIFLFALILVLGSILLIIFLVLELSGKKTIPSFSSHETPLWNLTEVFRVLLVYLFFGYILGLTEGFFASWLDKEALVEKDWVQGLNALILDIGIVIYIFFRITKIFGQSLGAIGIKAHKKFKTILWGFLSYIGFAPVMFSSVIISFFLMRLLGRSIQPHPLIPMMMAEQSAIVILFLVLLACVIGPICEEIIFRGLMYPAVREKYGVFASIIIIGVVFSLIHANLYAFLPIFFLGCFLTFLYERTGSLTASISVHIIHNSSMMALFGFYKHIYGLTQ